MNPTQKSGEQWLPVVGFEGLYEVSDLGRVRSLDRRIRQRNGRTRVFLGSIKSQVERDGGRLVVGLSKGNVYRARLVSQLVAEAFIGPRPAKAEVCHNNGDPRDNRAGNLRYDDHSGNMLDKRHHGTDHNLKKSHCPLGHPLSIDNLVPSSLKDGRRDCLACSRATSRIRRHPEWKKRRKELADAYYRAPGVTPHL